jgi:hypothetical protein
MYQAAGRVEVGRDAAAKKFTRRLNEPGIWLNQASRPALATVSLWASPPSGFCQPRQKKNKQRTRGFAAYPGFFSSGVRIPSFEGHRHVASL